VNNGNNDIPLVTQLNTIYPNPFNPITNISYSLAEDQKVNITVYNARGAKVKTLENSLKTVGKHSVVWKGNDSSGNIVASGIYFLKFQTNTKQTTKKLLLIK
jgi:flagellar hook assembly protein FlgD